MVLHGVPAGNPPAFTVIRAGTADKTRVHQ